MKVSTFWNKAFLAALHRLPPEQAETEATAATERCLKHWQRHVFDQVNMPRKFSDLSLEAACIRLPTEPDKG